MRFLSFWLVLSVVSCRQSQTLSDEPDVPIMPGALPIEAPFPAHNQPSKDKTELGRWLFYDPILSGNKDIACATCHHPEFGYAESLDVSIGTNGQGLGENRRFNFPNDIPFLRRNSQSILNTAYNGSAMFWDLRAKSLEQQALEPIKTFEEMRGHGFTDDSILKEVVERLNTNAAYKRHFQQVFKQNPSVENLAKALATFERTLLANNSRFDQYMRGDKSALSANEVDGMKAFMQSGCVNCHSGPMFSDFSVHALGVADLEKLPKSDSGFEGKYAFRTPSLRNLRHTGPYMHNGTLKTLENVLEFYEDLSGGAIRNPNVKAEQIDPKIQKLQLDFKDFSNIVEFLNTLNDDSFDKTIPKSVPSGLEVGGKIARKES